MKLTPERKKQLFIPNDPDKASVTIRYLKKGVRAELERDANSMVATAKDGIFTPTIEFNPRKKRRMYIEALVVEWSGFTDQHLNPLPCNVDNVELFAKEDPTFYPWLQKESDKFISEVEEEEIKAMGN